MSTPSSLGDLGYTLAAIQASTSSGPAINIAAGTDTGTVVATGVTLDLSKPIGYSNTGGKPPDVTVNPLARVVRRFMSIAIAAGVETVFHSSGHSLHIVTAHKTRAAASGVGSTWETMKTDTRRIKGGTDTDVTTRFGFISSVNAQAIKRYYKANITVKRLLASSTGAKDTSTDTNIMIQTPVYLLGVGVNPAQD